MPGKEVTPRAHGFIPPVSRKKRRRGGETYREHVLSGFSHRVSAHHFELGRREHVAADLFNESLLGKAGVQLQVHSQSIKRKNMVVVFSGVGKRGGQVAYSSLGIFSLGYAPWKGRIVPRLDSLREMRDAGGNIINQPMHARRFPPPDCGSVLVLEENGEAAALFGQGLPAEGRGDALSVLGILQGEL
jgi:hypothetical protein